MTPCGEVSVGMEKDQISVAGNITNVRTFMVRGENAAEIELQDQSGAARVIVWPDVYRKTTETWQVNTPVRVTGSVRVREEEASVDCRQFEVLSVNGRNGHAGESANGATVANGAAVAVAEAPAAVAEPAAEVAAPPQETVADAPPKPAEKPPPPAPPPAAPPKVLISVMLHETADEDADVEQLKRVVAALESHPGESPVQLVIMADGEPSVLTLPFQTAHSEALESDIAGILGGSYLTVQPLLM